VGSLSLSGTTRMTAATGLEIVLAQGLWTTAVGSSTTLRATAGALSANLADGSVTWRGSTVLEGDSVNIVLGGQQAGLSASNSTTLTADAGDLTIRLDRGNFSLQGSSSFSAARHLGVDMLGQGSLTLAGASTLSAGSAQLAGDLNLRLVRGDATLASASTLRGSQDVQLSLEQGSWRNSGATTVSAGRDLSLGIVQGSATLTQRTVIEAGGSARLSAEGGISASGLSSLSAGLDLTLLAQRVGFELSNTSSLQAKAGDLKVTSATGNLRIGDDSSWKAGNDVLITLGTGSVSTEITTVVEAGRDIGVRITDGSVELKQTSRWQAARDQSWQILDNGSLTMADAQTELLAGRDLSIDGVGDLRIDWLQAGSNMSLRSVRGALLDNTQAETDLLSATNASLDAAQGVGRPWRDNINAYVTQTLSAINRDSGGINLQNWVGVSVGTITNRGSDNVILIAGGPIRHGQVDYQIAPTVAPGSISSPPGLKIYLIHNQPGSRLLEQWGNQTPGYVNARTNDASKSGGEADQQVKAHIGSANLLLLQRNESDFDATSRLVQSLQGAVQTLQLSQPIRLAEVLRDVSDLQLRSPLGADLQPLVRAVSSEVGGAALLQIRPAEALRPDVAEQLRLESPSLIDVPLPASEAPIDGLPPLSGLPLPAELAQRPVLRQAIALADDDLDLPMIQDGLVQAEL
jgi:hypothetical protein